MHLMHEYQAFEWEVRQNKNTITQSIVAHFIKKKIFLIFYASYVTELCVKVRLLTIHREKQAVACLQIVVAVILMNRCVSAIPIRHIRTQSLKELFRVSRRNSASIVRIQGAVRLTTRGLSHCKRNQCNCLLFTENRFQPNCQTELGCARDRKRERILAIAVWTLNLNWNQIVVKTTKKLEFDLVGAEVLNNLEHVEFCQPKVIMSKKSN